MKDESHRVLYEIATSGERCVTKWTPANQATKFLVMFYGSLEKADEKLRADHDDGLRSRLAVELKKCWNPKCDNLVDHDIQKYCDNHGGLIPY